MDTIVLLLTVIWLHCYSHHLYLCSGVQLYLMLNNLYGYSDAHWVLKVMDIACNSKILNTMEVSS